MVIWKRSYGICTKRNWIGPIIMGCNGIQLTTIQYDIWGCLEIGDIPKVARSKCLNDDKPLYLRAPYFQTYCGSVSYIMVIDIDVRSIYTVYESTVIKWNCHCLLWGPEQRVIFPIRFGVPRRDSGPYNSVNPGHPENTTCQRSALVRQTWVHCKIALEAPQNMWIYGFVWK